MTGTANTPGSRTHSWPAQHDLRDGRDWCQLRWSPRSRRSCSGPHSRSWIRDGRHALGLPDVTEVDIARHYTHLASMNFGVDTGSYPLGSCTMKYNPRVNEDAARLTGFAGTSSAISQPRRSRVPSNSCRSFQEALAEVSGLPGVTLQPAAGAHGELTALMCSGRITQHVETPARR